MMSRKYKSFIIVILLVGAGALLAVYLGSHPIAVLQPKGTIGLQERHLMAIGLGLSAIVVIPVFIMTIVIAMKYREGNHKAKYSPDWDHSRVFETIWWGIPIIIIGILSVITWNSSHSLDPYKSLASNTKPMTIQVIALDWKWLFIYPEQDVASVNLVQFPAGTPVDFEITSDAPMNSFWIPQLGGQIYAMPGMGTQLHLMADQAGDYKGSSANISGKGFAGMKFTARASSAADFERWVSSLRNSPNILSISAYNRLAQPSQNNPVSYYSSVQDGLYNTVMMKFALPAAIMPGVNSDQARLVPMSGMHGSGL